MHIQRKVQGEVEGYDMDRSRQSFRLMLNPTVLLSEEKNGSADVSFFYQSPAINGNVQTSPVSSLNFSLNKQIKDIHIRLWANDLYDGYIGKFYNLREGLLLSGGFLISDPV
ncbi:MAG: outer membrane beta-barrel family protein [Tannerella sp.]|nr:outer membrane beta-barrel family protein [Tannerella sp.]